MTKPAIIVENLSKVYRRICTKYAHNMLKDMIYDRTSTLIRNVYSRLNGRPPSSSSTSEDFWALRDLNFEIPEGSRLGIIGSNGAGKSTLLKILSRIIEPTSGRAKVYGRISSLLEVGTGFHPELTGAENIYLNGAILGMRRYEIRQKFDEIVQFSELEKFMDTPLKRFSSGMQVRLAFAVAAHLDPDILIVDEVLAVGDLRFQQKCLKALDGIGHSGRTIIFVSHDSSKVLSLCNLAILLENGQLKLMGSPEACIGHYLGNTSTSNSSWQGRLGNDRFQALRLRVLLEREDQKKAIFFNGDRVRVEFDYQVLSHSEDFCIQLSVLNEVGERLATSYLSRDHSHYRQAMTTGLHRLSFEFDTDVFYEGKYNLSLQVSTPQGERIINNEISQLFSIYRGNEQQKELMQEAPCVRLGDKWKYIAEPT